MPARTVARDLPVVLVSTCRQRCQSGEPLGWQPVERKISWAKTIKVRFGRGTIDTIELLGVLPAKQATAQPAGHSFAVQNVRAWGWPTVPHALARTHILASPTDSLRT